MKKTKLFLVVILSTLTLISSAQKFTVGAKGGLSIPNLSAGGNNSPLSEGYSSRLAGGGGIFGEYHFSKLFSLQVGLEYSGQGGKKNGMQALPSSVFFAGVAQAQPAAAQMVNAIGQVMPKYLYYDVDSKVKFNYLMLPISAKFGWNLSPQSPFRVYVSGGMFVSYLLSGKRTQTGTSGVFADQSGTSLVSYYNALPTNQQPFPTTTDPSNQPAYTLYQTTLGILNGAGAPSDKSNEQNITEDLYRFNYGLIASVGISYNITPRHAIFIEGGGNYGLKKIQKNETNGQNRIGAGTIMAGYAYTFGAK